MRKLFRRIVYLLNRDDVERGLQQEMSAHRAMLTADRKTSFGPDLRLREESRDAWGWTWLDQVRQDLAYTIRTLARAPGFTLTAIGILALGVGVNLAIFHILNSAIFHRLSVRNPEAIIAFERTGRFPAAMIEFFREHNTVFSYVIAQKTGSTVFVDNDADPQRSTFVSGNFFTALGVNSAHGRLVDPRDGDAGAPPVVILSYRYWERHFGADPNIAGRAIHLNGKPVQIAGVAPPNFTGLAAETSAQQAALWLPLTAYPYLFEGTQVLSSFSQRDTEMFTALKPGVPLDAANTQLISLATVLKTQHPEIDIKPEAVATGRPLLYVPIDALVPIILVTLLFLLVLITACANLGNLLLARGYSREREIRIRMAVGAGMWRIVRQLMVENILLATLGSSAGLGVGYFAAKGLLYLVQAPPDLLLVTDWRILLACGMLALFSAAVFGLAPALQAVRARSSRPARARQILIGIQIGASCFLLILAGMLVRSVQRQFAMEVRFDFERMILVDPQLHALNLPGPAARQKLSEISARLERQPGVAGVAIAMSTPFGGRMSVDSRQGLRIAYNQVDPTYFPLFNLPLVRGRLFSRAEQEAVVLSESAARSIWPAEDPLGKTLVVPRFSLDAILLGKTNVSSSEQRTVIGVVKDSGATSGSNVEAYLPLKDSDAAKALIVVHASGDPAAIVTDARSVASLPGLTPSASLLRTVLDQGRGKQRGVIQGVGSLGLTATMLAGLGIFGLMAFAVAQRTREIGVRMALGARPADVIGTLLGQYAKAMGIGAFAGALLAAAIGRLLQSQMFGVRALEPITYVTALSAFAAVAAVAILIPARRALRVDPASALRWE